MQPFLPMSPILVPALPEGGEWIYQLKWDGFRIISVLQQGQVSLWSKAMLPKTEVYPELARALSGLKGGFVLDGEAVILDAATGRPSFQRMQQRDKLQDRKQIEQASQRQPVQYVLFDLLHDGEADLRSRSFEERYERLRQLVSGWGPPFYLADTFSDGRALWDWTLQHGWEGVVCKRRTSAYKPGKEHRDWYKRKASFHYEVEIVAVLFEDGRLSSLAMRRGGRYFGRISSGLDEKAKSMLAVLDMRGSQDIYFPGKLPEGLRGADVRWLQAPLTAQVTGREITAAGLLRHPKLQELEGIPL